MVDAQVGRDHLVVERRHDDLDPVVSDEPQIPEHVLLGRKRPAGGAGGPRRRGVDSFSEAVDARRTERERAGTLEEVPSRRSHHV